ncbi:MAG: hypothetical protein WC282_02590 [Bacilli bacterium]|jgi:hypothetical protein
MSFLNKRESLTQNITYMAIMAAVNAIFSLIATLVPILSVFLMIVLPLSSAIVFLFCKHRYYIIYAIATIGLCLIITMFDMSFTIFYIVPSVITGYVFGLFIKLKIHAVWMILLTSIIQALFTFLTIPLINVLFQVDFLNSLKVLLHVATSIHIDIIIPTFIFFLGLAQMVFSYIVVSSEIEKFGYQINDEKINRWHLAIATLVALILIVPLVFIIPSGTYLMLAIATYFMVFIIFRHIAERRNKILIALGGCLVAFLFLFALLFPLVPTPYGLLLFGLLPLMVAIVSLINNVLLIHVQKDKIRSKGER